MYEETGVLREPVRKYLEGALLTERWTWQAIEAGMDPW
jgi:hypothetical protein